MVKLISLRDETYKKLLSFKKAQGMSFSEAIETLINFYKVKKEKTGVKSLSGALKISDISKHRLRRVINE